MVTDQSEWNSHIKITYEANEGSAAGTLGVLEEEPDVQVLHSQQEDGHHRAEAEQEEGRQELGYRPKRNDDTEYNRVSQ